MRILQWSSFCANHESFVCSRTIALHLRCFSHLLLLVCFSCVLVKGEVNYSSYSLSSLSFTLKGKVLKPRIAGEHRKVSVVLEAYLTPVSVKVAISGRNTHNERKNLLGQSYFLFTKSLWLSLIVRRQRPKNHTHANVI